MKMVLIKSSSFGTKWATLLDFMTPRGLEITSSGEEKNVEDYKKEDKRVGGQKDWHSFAFLYRPTLRPFPPSNGENGRSCIDTVFINPDVYNTELNFGRW